MYIDSLEQCECLRKFIVGIPNSCCILSLNYDCVLDQALYYSNRWSPLDGYGYDRGVSTVPATGSPSKENIKLLKLHGSVNFKEQSEHQLYPFIELSEELFRGRIGNTNKSGSPHIIGMSYIKAFRNGLMSLWREAIGVLREAEHLIVVGCSLRDEDTFLRFALYHFGMKESCKRFKIDIVDNGNANTIKDKVKGLVAQPRLHEIFTYDDGLEGYLKTN